MRSAPGPARSRRLPLLTNELSREPPSEKTWDGLTLIVVRGHSIWTSLVVSGYLRSIRPLTDGHVELDHGYRSKGLGKDRGVFLIGAPGGGVHIGKLEHQVGQVMASPVGQVR